MEASKDTTNLRLTITVFYMMLQSAEAFVSQMWQKEQNSQILFESRMMS